LLAAEELDHLKAAERAAAERPQKQRRSLAVETDDEAGGDARRCADMGVPEPQEVVTLVGGRQGSRPLERAPIGLGLGKILINIDADGAAVDLRRRGQRRAGPWPCVGVKLP
jgi:hypothetical protein